MVELDAADVAWARQLLADIPRGVETAMARAMNRSLDGARTTAAKLARRRYRVSSPTLKATIRMRRASAKSLEAEWRSSGGRMPLFEFGPTPDRPGTGGRLPGVGMARPPLRVGVLRKKVAPVLEGAFVGSSGRRLHIWRRTGRDRLPIEPLFAPAVPQMLGHGEQLDEVADVAQARLDVRFTHEIDRILSRGKP